MSQFHRLPNRLIEAERVDGHAGCVTVATAGAHPARSASGRFGS